MKTLFLCCENNRANHLNEEYDEILYVTDKISTENMEEYHHRIKDAIRLAASEDGKGDTDRNIAIYIDGPSPYVWLAQQLAIEMKETDKLDIILPEVKEIVPPPEYNEIE